MGRLSIKIYMKIKLFLFSVLVSFQVFSQEPFLSIPNDLKTRSKSPSDAFAVVENENNSFAIFLDDKKTLNGYLYSENLEPLGKFSSNGLPKFYNEIIGSTHKNGQIRLFVKNQNNRNFGSVLFDFSRKATLETEYNFKLKGETYLQSHSYRDKFYILTVSRNSSILNIYVFDHDGKFDKRTFNFDDKYFGDRKNKQVDLDFLLTDREQFKTEGAVVKIEESNPNNIAITSKLNKIYDRKNSFLLTIDGGLLYTYLFEFKVPELNVNLKAIEKEQLPFEGFLPESNSYIFKDNIYQICALSDTLIFTVKNIDTKKEIKRIELSKDEEITFKNSPIIQEGTSFGANKRRELDKTSQFLRKITTEDIGLAVILTKDGYQITMGGNMEISNTGGGGAMIMTGLNTGMTIATVGAFTFSFNPVFYSFYSYKFNKSTRIECLFDENFEHIPGATPHNVFDTIEAFTLKNPKAKAETIFKIQNSFIYGKYNDEADTYELFKFIE
jgi:hypothetical protein|tara:strand:- start:75381 stop:76874 length:1494 start_codon:yes stop_codon:yes gene_type:complete